MSPVAGAVALIDGRFPVFSSYVVKVGFGVTLALFSTARVNGMPLFKLILLATGTAL